ncbi:MAG: hypothetical protein JW774_03790 [Candidatus Aureabacteria bacterium]|nr:hypothetical protein [Candidatus Auribacterota bacterium]
MRHIMLYTLLENMRARIYLSAIGLLLLIMGISWIGTQINYNLGAYHFAMLSFGMGLTKLLVTAIALFLPVFHISMEYEKGTAHVLWAKIENRSTYYTGKFWAFLILIFILILFAVVLIGGLALFRGAQLKQILYLRYFIFGQILESACILSMVFLVYALIRAPLLASLLTLLMVYFSIFLEIAKEVAAGSSQIIMKYFYLAMYYGMPKLSYFSLENHILYSRELSLYTLYAVFLYSICFSAVCLSLANIIFSKREM